MKDNLPKDHSLENSTPALIGQYDIFNPLQNIRLDQSRLDKVRLGWSFDDRH